jgi:hypothetical protein
MSNQSDVRGMVTTMDNRDASLLPDDADPGFGNEMILQENGLIRAQPSSRHQSIQEDKVRVDTSGSVAYASGA